MRPLNLLVAEALLRVRDKVEMVAGQLREHVGEIIQEMSDRTEAPRILCALPAADAAAVRQDRAPEPLGSKRIAERYPWHFRSPNAVDQRRSRLRKKVSLDSPPEPPGDRLVDLLLAEIEAEEG